METAKAVEAPYGYRRDGKPRKYPVGKMGRMPGAKAGRDFAWPKNSAKHLNSPPTTRTVKKSKNSTGLYINISGLDLTLSQTGSINIGGVDLTREGTNVLASLLTQHLNLTNPH